MEQNLKYDRITIWKGKEYTNTDKTLYITHNNRSLLSKDMESVFGIDNYYICELDTNFYVIECFRKSQEE
jgi:hypothetical protein